jgi:hypothetical protein
VPDYSGAAAATAAGHLEAARAATSANRANQITPYGNSVWTQEGPDRWRQDITLSPTGQYLFDTQNALSTGLANLGTTAINPVYGSLGTPFNARGLPAPGVAPRPTITARDQDEAEAAVFSRLEPRIAHDREMLRTRLANQGLVPGGEAYENEMRLQQQAENDARMQAVREGFNIANTAFGQQAQAAPLTQALRQGGVQEQAFLRSLPLNELNAIRTGAQVQNPTFTPVPMQQTTPGPNYLGAAQAAYGTQNDAYNSQTGANNAFMSGLFSLGGAALGAPWMGKFFG